MTQALADGMMSPMTDSPAGRPTVILFPGFMCDHALWDDMTGDLSTLGTLHYADLSRPGDLDDWACMLAEETEGLLILVGFSMGGYVARRLAAMVPERVVAMVLIGSSARGDTPERRERNRVAVAAQAARPYRGVSRKALSMALHEDLETDTALLDRMQGMSLRLGQACFLNQLSLEREDERPTLGGITVPTLVVAAESDRLRSLREAEEMRDGIPGARLAVIEGSGHMMPIEKPGELFTLIRDFVAEQG